MESEPTPLFSKPVIDPLNTAAWFTMDALWLARLEWPAYVAAVLTVVTGAALLVLGWREGRGALFADLGLNCWIVMNAVWLAHDLNGYETPRAFAVVVGILGFAVVVAARHSESPCGRSADGGNDFGRHGVSTELGESGRDGPVGPCRGERVRRDPPS